MMKLAVISDTHGLLRREVLPHLAAVDGILHAGDVGDIRILEELGTRAPLLAVRGNVDTSGPLAALPERLTVELGGHSVHMLHDRADLDPVSAPADVELVVFGHSHRPLHEVRDGIHFLNPGSIGPRRFRLPVCFAFVEWTRDGFAHTFVHL